MSSQMKTHFVRTRKTALDLFCGGGGASMGLHRAGFDVVGVDLFDQPKYPFKFIKADALDFDITGYDFVWASPPCQAFTAYKRRKDHVKYSPNLIPKIREKLIANRKPFVIENVQGAPLLDAAMLCGSMFSLDVRRHRFFESNFKIDQIKCQHNLQLPRFAPASNRKNLRKTVEIGVWRIPLAIQQKAMGIDWLDVRSLSQSIPPAYSEYIGRQFLDGQ